jgi:hypothetical protein
MHSWAAQLFLCKSELPVADLETLVLRLGALTARRDGWSRTAAATLTGLAGSGPSRLTEPPRPRVSRSRP